MIVCRYQIISVSMIVCRYQANLAHVASPHMSMKPPTKNENHELKTFSVSQWCLTL